MYGIFINKKDLHKYNMNILLKKTSQIYGNKNESLGIIFVVSLTDFTLLNKLPKGQKRVDYMNSDNFVNIIMGVYYIIYNEKNKICEIREHINNQSHLKAVVKSILTYLPENVTIWIGPVKPEKSGIYIEEGFSHPYKCSKSPLGFNFKNTGLAFIKNNSHRLDHSSIKNKLKYLEIDWNNISKCMIYIRFNPETILFLKKINRTQADKELSGSLVVSKITTKDSGGKIVFELSSNPNSIISGQEEEVDAVWSRYNFHTHPKKAYKNHGVKNGWPSSQDYVGFLELKNHTIFHTVVTLEGIYIISISSEWTENINKINKKIILKDYDVNHLTKISPPDYIKQINEKKYKNKKLFDVKYMDWTQTTQIFSIFFEKTNGNCLVTDDTFDISR